MKEVDWDIAPSGATHYNAECEYPWLKETPISYFNSDYDVWVEYRAYFYENAMTHLKNAVKRHKEWDGSGIPPVGTVCEYRLIEYGMWFTCKIIYVLSGGDDCFVARCDHLDSDQFLTFSSDRYKLQLRKIKTPKQIAEEERLHAIDELLDFVVPCSTYRDVMCAIYDAGYRKVEV